MKKVLMTMILRWITPLYIFPFFLVSCIDSSPTQEKLAPVHPTVDVEIIRFDHLLQSLPLDSLLFAFDQQIRKKYPAFTEVYTSELIKAPDSVRLLKELELTRYDSSYLQLYNEVQERLGDLNDIKPEISQTLENYLSLFRLPRTNLPGVYTFISGFAYQAFLFDDQTRNGIGLGLDMFLGNDFPYQQILPADPSFSQYLTRTYNKDHIIRKIAEVLVEDQMTSPAKSDFLHLMIWGGKKLFLIDQILDFVPDTIVTEYTLDQLDWCRNNEAQMWQYFFEKDLFYETDLRAFSRLIGPAPTSPGMPESSPGQTGNYMGWQIIRAYMARYPETSVKELIALKDAQLILDLSKYKPQRI